MQARKKRDVARRARTLVSQRPVGCALLAAACLASLLLAVVVAQGGSSAGVVVERASATGSSVETAGSASLGDGEAEDEESTLVVDVGGAVASPGVVELAEGSRVVDAIQAAGGLLEDADTTSLNQAALIEDGQKILVPHEGEASSTVGVDGSTSSADTAASTLVNINTADEAELDTLPGVGPATAQAIIEDRTQNGAFASIEDLMRVSGIGEKKFAKLQSLICV